ncbi:uncharacterized protein LOC115314554 [Ixodes scapularis]|uniref:uncharacterized protein LOC115314554 n=1 Tax=Ixodes scapularis TaxID=6945 RepID=UPI001A9D54CB|nr:uncharacterized protein LOC115314554 [Ixodes scapularis]
MINPHKLFPAFDYKRDDLDAYLKRFEHLAVAHSWPKEKWATALSMCLGGEALNVFGRLSPADSMKYDQAKLTLLQSFRFIAEGYREKFRESKPLDGETGKQYAARLSSFFDRWMEMSETAGKFESVRDIVVAEQFLNNCHSQLALFVRERNCKTLSVMAEATDHYLEAQRQRNLLLFRKLPESEKSKGESGEATKKPPTRCLVCDKKGHKASDCLSKPTQLYCVYCRRPGHDLKTCTKSNDPREASSCVSPKNFRHETQQAGRHKPKEKKAAKEVADVARKRTIETYDMPVVEGELLGQAVLVLRDTGSNTLIGTAIVKYLEAPLYDVIVGNVPGSHDATCPDPYWRGSSQLAVIPTCYDKVGSETEGHEPALVLAGTSYAAQRRRCSVVDIGSLQMTKKTFQEEQGKDASLQGCWAKVGKVFPGKGDTSHTFTVDKRISFRCYQLSRGKILKQAVLPKVLRAQALNMAHESPTAGHQGIKKTTDRILEAFYCPGVQNEVRRFFKSCDVCQKTFPKGKVGKVPLVRMPLIDTPFERVAVDVLGPLSPTSAKGNRYILSLVEFSTRYPNAVALPSIDSATVAERLVEMFSRIEFPREILCDRGTCFTSDLMREVNDLLAIKHLSTTPYYPMCNGMVERFNGTLKQM